jgi:hypothetical protein
MSVVEVSVTHPAGVANQVAGRDREKQQAYDKLESHGHPFIPFSVETDKASLPSVCSASLVWRPEKRGGGPASHALLWLPSRS